MTYINKEELLGQMTLDAPINWTDTDFELGEESQYRQDIEVIKNSTEVEVVPVSVLEEIKAEVEKQYRWLMRVAGSLQDIDIAFDSIIASIDKHIRKE